MHHRTHSPACTCGARHWRIETLPDGDMWVGHCQECGAERRWPTRDTVMGYNNRAPGPYHGTAHAPSRGSYIAIKPSGIERTW